MSTAAIALFLVAAYPVLLLAGFVFHVEALRHAGVAALLLAMFLPGLVAGRRGAWLAAAAVTVIVVWLRDRGADMLPLLVAPVLIPAGVGWMFGRTLRAGRTPLIEQIVRLLHANGPPPDPERLRYARRLTIAWAVLLSTLAAANAMLGALTTPGGLLELAGFAPPAGLAVSNRAWAAWTGIAGYLVVALFFAAEFLYRQRRFPNQPYSGFVDFVRRSIAAAPSLVAARSTPSHRRAGAPEP